MKTLRILSVILFTSIIFWGCEKTVFLPQESGIPVIEETVGIPAKTTSETFFLQSGGVSAAGFEIKYTGRAYNGFQTTFSYNVTGPAEDMHFRIELPSCAPAFKAISPSNGTTSNNDAYINPGLEWHPAVGSGAASNYNFSITYPGNVREGIILASIKTRSRTEVVEIPGACARVFDIGGRVFTDANKNGSLDTDELGIPEVDILLFDANGQLKASTATDGRGYYVFEGMPAGNYHVELDVRTLVVTQITYLNASSPTSLAVTIGPDSFGNDFGFEPKTDKLINDLKFDLLKTNGKTANYWKNQLKVAITGSGSADFSASTLRGYIVQIRSFLLADPFLLSRGDGLRDAFDLLDRPARSNREQLERELLAAELNHFAGFGILSSDPDLQLVLLSWGESLLANGGQVQGVGSSTLFSATSEDDVLSEAIDLFSSLNKSSGGGSGNN